METMMAAMLCRLIIPGTARPTSLAPPVPWCIMDRSAIISQCEDNLAKALVASVVDGAA